MCHRSYAIAAAPSSAESRQPTDHDTLALSALAWLLSDEARASRFLDLTGLDPADLRARAGSREVAVATLRFLTAHESDLVACAQALEVSPARLAAVGEEFER